MLVREFDEDIFEAGSKGTNLGDGDTVLQELFAQVVEIEVVFDEGVNGLSEDGGATDAMEMAREAERARDFGRGDFHAHGSVRLNVGELAERIGRAVGNELAVIDVGNVTAPLRFVHVMRGDEESDAIAGKLRGQPIEIGLEAVQLDNFVDAALETCGLQTVNASIELQVLRDGQIVVEAEILRHITDALANAFRIGVYVQPLDRGGTAAERQQAGEHFDDGGLSAAVGAQETEDFAFFDAEADVVDGGEVAEAAHKVLRGDGGVSGRLQRRGHGFSSPLSASHPQPYRQARGQRDHRCEFLCQ